MYKAVIRLVVSELHPEPANTVDWGVSEQGREGLTAASGRGQLELLSTCKPV